MKRFACTFAIFTVFLSGCREDTTSANRATENYEVVSEGEGGAAGSSTVLGVTEGSSGMTATSLDTTTAFTINPDGTTAAGTASAPPLAQTLPPVGSAPAPVDYGAAPAVRPDSQPAAQPAQQQPTVILRRTTPPPTAPPPTTPPPQTTTVEPEPVEPVPTQSIPQEPRRPDVNRAPPQNPPTQSNPPENRGDPYPVNEEGDSSETTSSYPPPLR